MNPQLLLLAAGGQKAPPLIDVDGTLIVQAAIFLLLLVVLTRFVFRPYLALREEQARNTAGAREEADKHSALADEKLATYEARIMEAKREAAKGRAEQRAQGEARAQQLLGDARQRADKKIGEARERIAKTVPAAQLSLRTRADKLAQAVASKILGREV